MPELEFGNNAQEQQRAENRGINQKLVRVWMQKNSGQFIKNEEFRLYAYLDEPGKIFWIVLAGKSIRVGNWALPIGTHIKPHDFESQLCEGWNQMLRRVKDIFDINSLACDINL